ncbi:bromodomain protein, putative [Hepatocystis sp. ex Piliocolobus tephrosceles]|nr:bromodomain protein, putative [Hepatocystis sp. ex Piliocolobus tephrosceles]
MGTIKTKYDELEEARRKNDLFLNLLNKLIAFDKKKIFLYPVNVQYVPDYLNIIKEPMDFTTMKHKIQSFKYKTFQAFEDDFFLIINNCYMYNNENTIYHKIAETVENYYNKICFKIKKKYMNIHLFYHREDKQIMNRLFVDSNKKVTKKNVSTKGNKKNDNITKKAKPGRPSTTNKNIKKNNIIKTTIPINYIENKNKIKKVEQSTGIKKQLHNDIMKNNVINTISDNIKDYTTNIKTKPSNNEMEQIQNEQNNNESLASLLDKEDFSAIISKISKFNDKSKYDFDRLINVLSDKRYNSRLICNYVNISKSLYNMFFNNSITAKLKMELGENEITNHAGDDIEWKRNDRKRGMVNINDNTDITNKRYKVSNNDKHFNDNSNYTQNDVLCENNNNSVCKESAKEHVYYDNSNERDNNRNFTVPIGEKGEDMLANTGTNTKTDAFGMNCDKQFNEIVHIIDDLNIKNPKTIVNTHLSDPEREKLKEIITCNIDNNELTMNCLNYKKSVKNFIGEENISTFKQIFPNIYEILNNLYYEDLYYPAFNDLRVFGLDVNDIGVFNEEIKYNKKSTLGINGNQINDIMPLYYELPDISYQDYDKSHFYNKIKNYTLNHKTCYNQESELFNNAQFASTVAPPFAPPFAPTVAPPFAPTVAPPFAPTVAPPFAPTVAPPFTAHFAPPFAPPFSHATSIISTTNNNDTNYKQNMSVLKKGENEYYNKSLKEKHQFSYHNNKLVPPFSQNIDYLNSHNVPNDYLIKKIDKSRKVIQTSYGHNDAMKNIYDDLNFPYNKSNSDSISSYNSGYSYNSGW